MPSTPTGLPSSEAGLGSEAKAPRPGPTCPIRVWVSHSLVSAFVTALTPTEIL